LSADIPQSEWLAFALLFSSIVTLLVYSEGLYAEGLPRRNTNQILALGRSVGWATAISAMAGFLGHTLVPGNQLLPVGALLNFGSLVMLHSSRKRCLREGCSARSLNVLILGAGPTGRRLARYLRQNPQHRRVVRGFLDDQNYPGFGVLGRVSDLAQVARAEFVDEVIVAFAGDPALIRWVNQEAHAQHLDLRLVPSLPESSLPDEWIDNWAGIPLITLHRESLPAGPLLIKRWLDVSLASLGLLLLGPMLLLLAALIRLDSLGPALYAAPRAGRKGRRFRCFKFRTMVRDADLGREELRARNEREGPCFKLREDPRITRLGRWLRRYSLDELPQLWNVVRGDMSLVGPRPHPLDDCARYDLDHLRRLDVTPGMTGLWQVSARQSSSFRTNFQLDLEYIENWSLGLDLRILWATLAVVVRGTGI
jgi:exopolysaccharide biosynthesis polyprenyl glycosylphosphotransferase